MTRTMKTIKRKKSWPTWARYTFDWNDSRWLTDKRPMWEGGRWGIADNAQCKEASKLPDKNKGSLRKVKP